MDAVAIPGGRDVRATLDGDGDARAVVVACPPHPELGGSRSDQRLTAVSDALTDRGLACLRFDYGPWDEGREARPEGAPRGERRDARNAIAWADDEFEAVGVFGYSFGAGIALGGAADAAPVPFAVSVLAPDAEAANAIDALDVPIQVVYGDRDETVDWQPVVERARTHDHDVASLPAGHHFVGQTGRAAALIAEFLENSA